MEEDSRLILESLIRGEDLLDELYEEHKKLAEEIKNGVVAESFNDIISLISSIRKKIENVYKNYSFGENYLRFFCHENGIPYDFMVISDYDLFKFRLLASVSVDGDLIKEKIIWEGLKEDISSIPKEIIIKEFIVFAFNNNIFERFDIIEPL